MSSTLRNEIRSFEPQKLLTKVVITKRVVFLIRQKVASECKIPVSPNVEEKIGTLIRRSLNYQDLFIFAPETSQIEATMAISTDRSVHRCVKCVDIPNHPSD